MGNAANSDCLYCRDVVDTVNQTVLPVAHKTALSLLLDIVAFDQDKIAETVCLGGYMEPGGTIHRGHFEAKSSTFICPNY